MPSKDSLFSGMKAALKNQGFTVEVCYKAINKILFSFVSQEASVWYQDKNVHWKDVFAQISLFASVANGNYVTYKVLLSESVT